MFIPQTGEIVLFLNINDICSKSKLDLGRYYLKNLYYFLKISKIYSKNLLIIGMFNNLLKNYHCSNYLPLEQ